MVSRIHQLDKKTLTIQKFYPSLGILPRPSHDTKEPLMPEDIDVDWQDPLGMEFLLKTTHCLRDITEAMAEQYCEIKWPEDAGGKITLKCTLSRDMKNFYHLAKGWTTDVKGLLSSISTSRLDIPAETQPEFEKQAHGIIDQYGSEMIHVIFMEHTCHIAGRTDILRVAVPQMMKLMKEIKMSKRRNIVEPTLMPFDFSSRPKRKSNVKSTLRAFNPFDF